MVKLREGESFDSLLKRFKKECQKSGRLIDYRKHEYYEAPSLKAKRKHEAAMKRENIEKRKMEKYYN